MSAPTRAFSELGHDRERAEHVVERAHDVVVRLGPRVQQLRRVDERLARPVAREPAGEEVVGLLVGREERARSRTGAAAPPARHAQAEGQPERRGARAPGRSSCGVLPGRTQAAQRPHLEPARARAASRHLLRGSRAARRTSPPSRRPGSWGASRGGTRRARARPRARPLRARRTRSDDGQEPAQAVHREVDHRAGHATRGRPPRAAGTPTGGGARAATSARWPRRRTRGERAWKCQPGSGARKTLNPRGTSASWWPTRLRGNEKLCERAGPSRTPRPPARRDRSPPRRASSRRRRR